MLKCCRTDQNLNKLTSIHKDKLKTSLDTQKPTTKLVPGKKNVYILLNRPWSGPVNYRCYFACRSSPILDWFHCGLLSSPVPLSVSKISHFKADFKKIYMHFLTRGRRTVAHLGFRLTQLAKIGGHLASQHMECRQLWSHLSWLSNKKQKMH